MTFLIYIMFVKIYCELIGSYADAGTFVLIGFVMWIGHCVVKYMLR